MSDSPVLQYCYFPVFASVLLMCGEMLSRRPSSPTPSPRGGPEFQPRPHPWGVLLGTRSSPTESRRFYPFAWAPRPLLPDRVSLEELCKSCFLVSIQRQFHAVRSSLCCARGRTDTDLIDISVGGKGEGVLERLSLEELQHLVRSVSLCLSFLA